jgi:Predicted transmembrane protein 161AB
MCSYRKRDSRRPQSSKYAIILCFSFCLSLIVGSLTKCGCGTSFFGLYFCKEPTPNQLAALAVAREQSAGNVPVRTVGKGKKKVSKAKVASTPKNEDKPDGSLLPLIRAKVQAEMFLAETELPKVVEFDHILGMSLAYLMSYLAEEFFLCYFPDSTVVASQIQWFAALILCMGLWELASMSISMSSVTVWAGIGIVSAVGALATIANGDTVYLFQLDSGFGGLKAWIEFMLIERFSVGELKALRHALRFTTAARVLVSLLGGGLAACLAVPARRFARYDYDLYQRYRRNDEDISEDPYTLPRPTHWVILGLALDHILPLVALGSFVTAKPHVPEPSFRPLSLALMTAALVLRLGLGRIRLQAYLDGAINAFREFSEERSGKILEAGRNVRVRTLSTYYFLPTVGCMYTCGPIITLMLALTAKRSGNMTFGLCRLPKSVAPVNLHQSSGEIIGFLAWFAMSAHSLFSFLSLGLDALLDYADPATKRADNAPGRTFKASTRRRLRRMQAQDG